MQRKGYSLDLPGNVEEVTESGLESKEHLERSGKLTRDRTTSALYLNNNDNMDGNENDGKPPPRSNTAQDLLDDHRRFASPPERRRLPEVRVGDGKVKQGHQRQHSGGSSQSRLIYPSYQSQQSYSSLDFGSSQYPFSERPYQIPAIIHKMRNGVKVTEVQSGGSRPSSSMSGLRTSSAVPFERYASPFDSSNFDAGTSISINTKTDFDLKAVENYAAVRTRDELPKSIPIKDSESDFVVVGLGTYSYDGMIVRYYIIKVILSVKVI